MAFTTRKTYRWQTTIVVVIFLFVLILCYWFLFIGQQAWLSTWVGAVGEAPDNVATYAKAVSWLVGIAVFLVSVYVLGKVPKWLQLLVTYLELLMLLVLFMTTFNIDMDFILRKLPFLITQGAFTTLYVTVISIALAFCLALVTAIARRSSNGVAEGIATFYISLFRGLPLLLQIFILYLGLPQLGFVIKPIPVGIIALALCYGAYMSEVIRAGIQAVPLGQWEAALALGLHRRQVMRRIVLPQALKIIIPPVGNHFISMLKDSSLVSVVGVWELTYLSSTLGNRDFKNLEMLITAAGVYWVITITLEVVQRRIEHRFDSARTR